MSEETTRHMQVAAEAVRLFMEHQNAFAYEQATLAVLMGMLNELHLIRVQGVRSTEYVGRWMERIDSQLDGMTGDHK
ncbi:MAG: hypothetical protein BroJett021_28160 [Chloroflexota bacterium]|nr:MAG: hypothetical protein BroJett021_28160 [Chloroflexota bacterium]